MIAVLRPDLLLVTADRMEQMYALREFTPQVEKEFGVKVIVFGGVGEILDVRDAPPEVVEAALVIEAFLKKKRTS